MTPPGLTQDEVVIQSAATTTDTEGTPNGDLSAVGTYFGTVGMPTDKDQAVAAQRGETVDDVLAIASSVPVKLGHIVTARGKTWTVVAIRDVRLHQRVLLRRT
jgi:hypothetical protein